MRTRYPRIVIAGLRGGSGKTIVSLGLLSSWLSQGLPVTPFKKGPDYIDAGWLSAAASHPCFNLDPFLVRKEAILSSFISHYGRAQCSLIEGNRGVYDGMDAAGTYSTAELAKTLKAPVILVVDCTKATRTIGAMILGMIKFDSKVDIRGVILNRIAGKRHREIIRETIELKCGIPVLGSIPRISSEFLSERHMGLTPFQEHPDVTKVISEARDLVQNHVDIRRVRKIAQNAGPLVQPAGKERKGGKGGRSRKSLLPAGDVSHVRIGVVRDSAFQFYYPENFEELEKSGAELVEVSALKAGEMPDVDALYIGGGFPETHAIALAENRQFRKSVRKAVEAGLPVYAECGGFMYLGDAIRLGSRTYPMAGVFPVRFCLEQRPQAHGYTVVEAVQTNPFYARNTVLRGHEFHYSRIVEIGKKDGMYFAFRMRRGEGIQHHQDGLCYRNALATYTHLHALGSPQWVEGMVGQARDFHAGKNRSSSA